jgi:D-alanine-D-alanine ligase
VSADPRKLRVGVLFGGRSGEHEVSLASAASIIRGLDPEKYEAVPIGISKEGHWLAGAGAQKMLPEVLKAGQRVVMSADPSESALISMDGGARGQKLDVIFPVIHGTFGEDGTMQGLLELAGVPFVGAGVLGSAIGMDKDVAKKLLQVEGIPVVPWIAVQRADWERNPKEIRRAIEKKFKYPVFVKPATLGSSVGMTKVHSRTELGPALDLAAEFAMKIMVERAVNAREIEVSVLGNHDPQASIPGEIVPHREFYDYAAKYLEEGTQLLISREAEESGDQKSSGDGRQGVSRAGIKRNGASGFFYREARRKNFPERSEHHPRIHFHQHVSEVVGSERNSLPRTGQQVDRPRAGAASRKSADEVPD